MKKITALLLAALLVVGLCACGSTKSSDTGDGGKDGGSTGGKGSIVDVGDFTVAVPDGWANFDATDPFGETDAQGNYPVRTDMVYIVKGGTSEYDVLSSKPCVTITYYADMEAESQFEDMSWWFDDPKEVEYTANGVACKALETTTDSYVNEGEKVTYYYIFVPLDKGCFEVNFGGLELGDKDVKSIIESLSVN